MGAPAISSYDLKGSRLSQGVQAMATNRSFSRPHTHWIGGVAMMAAMLGLLVGLGTGSTLWALVVTGAVGVLLVIVLALMSSRPNP
jgi:hypothetical protein